MIKKEKKLPFPAAYMCMKVTTEFSISSAALFSLARSSPAHSNHRFLQPKGNLDLLSVSSDTIRVFLVLSTGISEIVELQPLY